MENLAKLAAAALALLAACVPAKPRVEDIRAERIVIAPGETVRLQIPPDPNPGPPEAAPVLYLTLETDVPAEIVMDGERVRSQPIILRDPSKLTLIEIRAAGYRTWSIAARFQLRHSRHLILPVRLVPLPD